LAVTAIDEDSGERIWGPISPLDYNSDSDSDYSTCRLFVFNGQPYVFYSTGGGAFKLYARKLSPTSQFDSEVLLASGSTTYGFPAGNTWDVLNFNDLRIVVGYSVSTVDITTRYFDEDLVELTSPYDVKTYNTGSPFAEQITLSMSSEGNSFFGFASDGTTTTVEYMLIGSTANTLRAMQNLGIDAGIQQDNLGGLCIIANPENLDGEDGVRGFYNPLSDVYGDAANGFGRATIRWHIANDGTLTVQTSDYQGHGYEVISKGWQHGDNWYYLMYRSAENNNCYYIGSWTLEDENPRLVISSQILYGRVPDGDSQYRPTQLNANFVEISPGVARVAVISLDSLSSVPGVVSVKVDFTSRDRLSAIPYGRTMVLAGMNLHAFCGKYLRELNFFYSPRKLRLSELDSGGYIPEGTFSMVVVYEFTDRNGYLHRSNPSPPASITTVAGDDNSIQVDVEQYVVTNSNYGGKDVELIAYRTTNNGTIYYRDAYYEKTEGGSEPASPTNQVNFPFLARGGMNLTRSDEELETQPVLFTVSGEIPPTPIPPVKYLTSWGSRIWAGGSARDENIYYSKINQTNLMPEFSELFSTSVQDKPGRTTGLIGLSDKIVMSKRGRLFYAFGGGPDNLGGGGAFSKFEEIPGVSGAVNGKSMVVNSSGINFKSDKGVYTLSPSLETIFSGAAYEDAVDEEIIQSVTPIDSETIRFVTESGILAYNTFFNAWSKDSSSVLAPKAACLYDNVFHVMTDDAVFKENKTKWLDGDTGYDFSVETGWTSLASIVGFQRFYKLFIVMDNLTPYSVTVSLAYDYRDYEDTTTFLNSTDSRIIIYPTRQKCEAFRFKIEVTARDGLEETEQTLNINFIGIEAGTKQGLPKQLPVSKRIGVT